MQTAVPLACFLSMIRPPGVQYENALLQIAPVDKSKCPYVKDNNDIGFQLFTRHNPTVFQELTLGDDEKLFASNIDFHDKTVVYFHAWMEQPDDGSGIMVREAYMQRGDTNVIMVDAHTLEAGPWYFTAAQNTWYIGRFAALFIDYLASRGLNLNNTHLIGHSLGAQAAGVAGSALKSGRVARITGLDPALPLFEGLPLEQRLDTTDAHFVDIIHTDAGIFGYKAPMGHADFFPNGGISPQPGCELEVVIPKQLLLNKCDMSTQTQGFYSFYLTANQDSHIMHKTLESKLANLFAFIFSVKAKDNIQSDNEKLLGKDVLGTKNAMKRNIDDGFEGVDVKNENNRVKDVLIKDTKEDYLEDKIKIENEKLLEISDLGTDNDTRHIAYNSSRAVSIDNKSIDIKSEEKSSYSIKDILTKEGHKTTETEDIFEDQIAEASEYDITQVEYNRDDLKNKETVSLFNDSIEKILEDDNTKINATTSKSNLIRNELFDIKDKADNKNTTKKVEFKTTERENTTITLFDADFKTSEIEENNKRLNDKQADKRAIYITHLNYKDPCEPKNASKDFTTTSKTIFEVTEEPVNLNNNPKDEPQRINILNILGTTYRISRVISSLKEKKPFVDKIKKLFGFKHNKIETTTQSFIKKLLNNNMKAKNHVVKRQKRFLPFFKRNEESESNNILFKMLDFLVKNRKNVLPVFTVMREINTLVKSGNGELNHFTKEQNNYIGATPPTFAPITYNLELGNENRAVAFVKRLLGMSPKGDRLTISGRK